MSNTNNTKKEKCTCGEPHISSRVQHCYDGKPCFVKEHENDSFFSHAQRLPEGMKITGASTSPSPQQEEEDFDSPYCPKCKGCGEVACDGVRSFIDAHIKGKTDCLYEESFIHDIVTGIESNDYNSGFEDGKLQGIKEERERWINQPANEHDQKIKKAVLLDLMLKKVKTVQDVGAVVFKDDIFDYAKENGFDITK